MIETLFAALGLTLSLALLLRLFLPEPRRTGLDRALRRGWARVRNAFGSLRRLPQRRDEAKDAERLAREAIERARRVDWQGNVARPRQFRRPPAKEE